MSEIRMTAKQKEIMFHILAAADRGYAISMPQLRAELSYGADVTKQAVLCSLRQLEGAGMIVKEYGRGNKPMKIKPTALAYAVFKGYPGMPKLAGE